MKKYVVFVFFFGIIGGAAFCQSSVPEYWLYFGLRLGGSVHFFDSSEKYFGDSGLPFENSGSFDAAIQTAFQPFDFFAIQTELIYTKDTHSVSASGYLQDSFGDGRRAKIAATFDMHILTVPVLAKFIHKSKNFYLAGLGGIYFNIPLGKAEMTVDLTLLDYNYTVSASEQFTFKVLPMFVYGGIFGIKLGAGTLFFDIRYYKDSSGTQITVDQSTVSIFRGNVVCFSLGYEIGFILK